MDMQAQVIDDNSLSTLEVTELAACEQVIERGLKTYYEVGSALMSIRDNRLYREAHSTFEDYCQQRWQMGSSRARQLILASETAQHIQSVTNVTLPREGQVRALRQFAVDIQPAIAQAAVARYGQPTASEIERVGRVFTEVTTTGHVDVGNGTSTPFDAALDLEDVEAALRQRVYIEERQQQKAAGTPAALQSSESNEWYTPAGYIEAARAVMGAIDLDPASNPYANRTVKASYYYTAEDDGFAQTWYGRVWLNPPYGRDSENDSNQGKWSARLTTDYLEGRIEQGVLLVNAVTDRQWFAPLWNFPICFVAERIKFYTDSERKAAPTHGNVLVYFGKNVDAFVEHFCSFGRIVLPRGSWSEALHE